MKITDLELMEEQLRGMAQAMEEEYWKMGKRLQAQSFDSRKQQRFAMQMQAEVLQTLTRLDEAKDVMWKLRTLAKTEQEQS